MSSETKDRGMPKWCCWGGVGNLQCFQCWGHHLQGPTSASQIVETRAPSSPAECIQRCNLEGKAISRGKHPPETSHQQPNPSSLKSSLSSSTEHNQASRHSGKHAVPPEGARNSCDPHYLFVQVHFSRPGTAHPAFTLTLTWRPKITDPLCLTPQCLGSWARSQPAPLRF